MADRPASGTAGADSLISTRRRVRLAAAYGAVTVAVVAAGLARYVLASYLGAWLPFSLFFIPVLVAVRFSGRGPAVFGLLLGAAGGILVLFEIAPPGPPLFTRPQTWISLGFYLAIGASIIGLVDSFRRARRRAAASRHLIRARHTDLKREVAARRLTEAELMRYRLLAESTRDIVLFIRVADARVMDANAAAISAYGYSRGEFIGRAVLDLRAPATRPTAARQLAEADESGVQFETVHVRSDGTEFPVEVSARGADLGGERVVLSLIRDVTDRKRREAAHRASEERLRVALDAGGMGWWELDLRTLTLTCSTTCKAIFGRTTHDAFGYADLTATIHEDDRPLWKETVDAAIAACSDFRVEYRARWPDGTVHWVAVRGSSAAGPDGRAAVLSGVSTDVTDRKQSEAARPALAAIVEHSTDPIVGKTLDGVITSWNAAAERVFGYPAAEAVGVNIAVLIPPDRFSEEAAILGRLRQGEVIEHFETQRQRKDGRLIDVSLTISPIRDAAGRVIGASKIARDVTERKRAAAELATQNARLRALTNTVRHLLAGDQPGDFVPVLFRELAGALGLELYFNYRATDDGRLRLDSSAGVSADEAAAIEWLDFGAAVCGCVALKRSRRVVDDVQSRTDPLTALIRRLGVTAYACHPLIVNDRLLGTLSFGTRTRPRFSDDDVALMQAVCDHVALAVERADLLDRTRRLADQLSEADRRKDEFLATLAHELRNPLAPVRNAVHLLRLQNADPRVAAARDMIDRQVTHLTRLVDDLLDVSRISRGKIALRPERVDLRDVLRRSAETARPLMDAKQHRLEVDLPADPVPVDGDATRLAQVVDNLLTNAGKYTDPGGTVRLSVSAADGTAVVRVRDNGAGIPPEALAGMFDLYAQAERTLDRAQGGLGIGLALVRRLVDLHNGSVAAFSDGPGSGSEFTVQLPLAPASPGWAPDPNPVAEEPLTPADPGRLRVLVVDDNEDAAESLAELLKLLGHEPTVAFDGLSGLDAARQSLPDVAILDIGLPGLSGYDLARQVRTELGTGVAALVAVSGYGQDDDRRRSQEAGFDYHLTKPVGIAELQAIFAETSRPG